MPHINLPDGVPGIVGPLTCYPNSAKHLSGLAQAVLRGPSSLTPAEREIIATFVSSGNECHFCTNSHAAAARHLLGDQCQLMDDILTNATSAQISDKLRTLLAIAGKVRRDGRLVTAEDIQDARDAGADDQAIHDTVLISACSACTTAMSMAWQPGPPETRPSTPKWAPASPPKATPDCLDPHRRSAT